MTIRRPAQLAQFKARSHERLVFQLVGRHCVARPIGQLIARVNIFARPISEANLWLQFCRRTCGWDKFNWAKGAKETVGKGDNNYTTRRQAERWRIVKRERNGQHGGKWHDCKHITDGNIWKSYSKVVTEGVTRKGRFLWGTRWLERQRKHLTRAMTW